jgi:uncharacterized repeat protein (TIGR01451 family)
MHVEKSASPTVVEINQPLTYTLRVTSIAGNSKDVVVSDTLERDLTFLQLIQDGDGACSTPQVGSTGTVTCILGGLGTQEVRTIQFSVTPTAAGTATNVGAVAWENPPGSTAESGTTETEVVDPTLVVIGEFEVLWDGNLGSSLVRWVTLAQHGTIGFHLERSAHGVPQPSWERLNEDLLPALIPAPLGGEYRFEDRTATFGETCSYRLIELEASGAERTCGPWHLTVTEAP